MIQEKYMIEGSTEEFTNIMEAVHAAMEVSRRISHGEDGLRTVHDKDGDNSIAVYRMVKYTHDAEWRSYTLNRVTFPKVDTNVSITNTATTARTKSSTER